MEIYFFSKFRALLVCFLELLSRAAKSPAYKSWRRAEGNSIMRISFDYLNFCYRSSRQGRRSVILFFITLAKMKKKA